MAGQRCVVVSDDGDVGAAVSILVGATAGALLCPLVARPISRRLPDDLRPFIGNTTSMALCTALVIATLNLF